MSSVNQRVFLNTLTVFVSALLLSACNLVDPASDDSENTAPSVFLFDLDPMFLVPGQMRRGQVYVADTEQDQITLIADGTIGPGDNPYTQGVADLDSNNFFYWTPSATAPIGPYNVRFTATDNGSPSLSSNADLNITLTDTLGLGAALNRDFCDVCHVDGDAKTLRELQVPCDEDGLEVALFTANIVEPNMLFLGLSLDSNLTTEQKVALEEAYNTDVNAVAVYLSSEYAKLDYECSIHDQTVIDGRVLDVSVLTTGTLSEYTIELQSVTENNVPIPYPSGASINLNGDFTWTSGGVGEYAVRIIITENATSTVVFNEVFHISVTPDNSGLGEDLYTQHCVGCHLADASRDMPNIASNTNAAQMRGYIDSAITTVARMQGFTTILPLDLNGNSPERDAIAGYLCGLSSACN